MIQQAFLSKGIFLLKYYLSLKLKYNFIEKNWTGIVGSAKAKTGREKDENEKRVCIFKAAVRSVLATLFGHRRKNEQWK